MTGRCAVIDLKIIAVGNIKEKYLREASAEYEKRLSAFCRVNICEIKEAYLPPVPTEGEITSALESEAEKILAAVPPRAFVAAMAIEGRQFTSEELAKTLENAVLSTSDICFIIGSSHGLSPRVKARADMRISLSKLTFPHRLFRIMLLESIYRSFSIVKGTKYHK